MNPFKNFLLFFISMVLSGSLWATGACVMFFPPNDLGGRKQICLEFNTQKECTQAYIIYGAQTHSWYPNTYCSQIPGNDRGVVYPFCVINVEEEEPYPDTPYIPGFPGVSTPETPSE